MDEYFMKSRIVKHRMKYSSAKKRSYDGVFLHSAYSHEQNITTVV